MHDHPCASLTPMVIALKLSRARGGAIPRRFGMCFPLEEDAPHSQECPVSAPDQYQAVVIGSGQGGNPLCKALAQAGMRTALVEREHVGGTCVNEGCTPTKTMVASGRVAYLARRGADYGIHTGDIRVDMERVRQRKRDIVNSFRNGSQKHIEKTSNLDLIFG